eukprot:TRINITY_DN5429_c0_g2_i2.p1 TRINITY_DN5429_c0_g2~~TRINITY_DN5429_c0_g2_i2.p1  ORF type:complete len:304 (+),score=93.74 TRINITY_DN5429_c0_g2_i2:61-972(+)
MSSFSEFVEALARKQKMEPPSRYGYKADVALGVGFWTEETTGCKVLEKPILIPSGENNFQGYVVTYAYCGQEGVEAILQGQMPPILPASKKEPAEFKSLAAIADNFGLKDPQAAAGNSQFCVAIRCPAELVTQAETPGRDIWMVRFDQDVVSPLLQAAKEGDAAAVTKALGAGAKGNSMDEDGVTALMMAAMIGSTDCMKILLSKNADVNAADGVSHRTALMFAAQGGHTEAVKLLCEASADVTKVDAEGATALMWAAAAGKAETAKLLANSGNKDAKNKLGLTALEVAEKMGHADTIAALKA